MRCPYWLLKCLKQIAVIFLLVSFALFIRIGPLDFLETRQPYTTFYPVVMIAALYAGFPGGLLATALSCLCAYFGFFIGYNFVENYAEWVGFSLFALIGTIFSLIGHYYLKTRKRLKQALIKAHRIEYAMDNVDSYIYIKDKNHRYVYANTKTLEFFNCTMDELANITDWDVFPPKTVEQLHAIDNRVVASKQPNSEEIISMTPEGQTRVYWETKTPLFDISKPQEVWGLCGISTDITERKLQEIALRESEERFRSTFTSAPIGMAMVDLDGRFFETNDALCDMLGYSHEEMKNLTFQNITHPDDLAADLKLVDQLKQQKIKSYRMEKRYYTKSGDILWILLTGSVVHDQTGQIKYFIVQIVDISAHKQLVENLNDLASRDYLTNLFNRRSFMELGEREFARAKRLNQDLALLMLDIDKFKLVNDNHGHKSGDTVLQRFSQLIEKDLRQIDLFGRLGGEEFAILLPNTDIIAAKNTAERLRELIETSVLKIGHKTIQFTISIGVSCLHPETSSLETMLNEADKALYIAKNSGRNQVCLSQEIEIL